MIIEEISNHVSPAQAIAAAWLFTGFVACKAAQLGAEWAWCSLTGREVRPCGCQHCVNMRMAAELSRARVELAEVIPLPLMGEASVA